MKMNLETLSEKVKQAIPTATTRIYPQQNQIIVGFTNRPDVEIALLTPYLQMKLRNETIQNDDLSEMLFSLRRISNT